jgi:cell division protease FtsH
MINFPDGPMTKDTIRKDIILTLGGYAAEKLIFGEEHTSSGVQHDIENATELANRAVRKYAMGSDPIYITQPYSNNNDSFYHSEKYSQEAIRVIKECMQEAEQILRKDKLLLLKMGSYLTTHSRMDEGMIADFIKRYSTEEWVRTEGFIQKDEYYTFDNTLELQIKELEQPSIKYLEVEMI